jgi:Leucine-rich repeat (LRR) protein
MDQIKSELEELKIMQKHPKIYLSNYFNDLLSKIYLEFIIKEEIKQKWLEIKEKIQLFESKSLEQIKPFNTYDNEIHSIEQKLQNNSIADSEQAIKLIDDLKLKIETILFSNKTILFMNDYGLEKKSFLLIINDEYLRKSAIDEKTQVILTKENLKVHLLKEKLKNKLNINNNNNNVISLNIKLQKETKFYFDNKQLKEINKSTFDGLNNLKEIHFINNQIKVLHPKTFNGLINLQIISFVGNQLKEIIPNTFKDLVNLVELRFNQNKIKIIHQNTFKDLINLKKITFVNNKIEKLNLNTFNGLDSLEYVDFSSNKISKIDQDTFRDLKCLKIIHLHANKLNNIKLNIESNVYELTFRRFSMKNEINKVRTTFCWPFFNSKNVSFV